MVKSNLARYEGIRLLCIDPSVKQLGIAVFMKDTRKRIKWKLEESYELYIPARYRNSGNWTDSIAAMVNSIRKAVVEFTPEKALIEMPQPFNSIRGNAARNSFAIAKLMGCVFAIKQMIEGCGVEVMLVPVSMWKGQTPKSITQKRIRKHWQWQGDSHNEADAVGLGDWYIRKHLPSL